MTRDRVGRATICACSLTSLMLLGGLRNTGAQDAPRSPVRARTTYEDLQMFSQVLNQIRVNHPDSVDTHELLMAAIQGMVRAADPHSYVIPAIRLEPGKEEQWRSGKLHPMPVSFMFIGGAPVVASVAAGTAASRLDILPGDELVAVDGRAVTAESAEELEIGLAGPKQSAVTLAFERRRQDGSFVRLERRVVRERFAAASAVPVAMMLDSSAGTGYVRITTFAGERVADDLHDALDRLEKRGMKRLVLDLRDNGGGSVKEAADVAGEFLPKGAIVYTSAGRKKEVTDTGRVSRSFWRSERRYPIVVMTNGGTASASELVAGALQDHDRALIVGRPSFGKSLLMRGFPLADGSAIVLVIGHVKTPCGRVVQRQYRSITTREYYRLARADRDTVGRPACVTNGGRRVFGGGGIYPDVVLDETAAVPSWLARVYEQELVLSWVGGYVSANSPAFASLDAFLRAPSVPAAAVADFRAFAGRQGVVVPSDAETDATLGRVLAVAVARAKWADIGSYGAEAVLDPEVRAAVKSFDRAAMLLGPTKASP
jgi:carboxyl-terminal processing protease